MKAGSWNSGLPIGSVGMREWGGSTGEAGWRVKSDADTWISRQFTLADCVDKQAGG